MPLETPARLVSELASRGYNAEREAVTLLADAADPDVALDRALETIPDDTLVLSADHVRTALESEHDDDGGRSGNETRPTDETNPPDTDPSVSTGTDPTSSTDSGGSTPVETEGSSTVRSSDPDQRSIEVHNDMTGQSTGTGEYSDFVSVFRDRYEKLSKQLRGRVNHRPTNALERMSGGEEAAIVGMVSDIRSTASGHWLIELEDTNGTFPCLVMKDRAIADLVQELLYDEVIAVDGTLADDGGILFVDSLHFPDIPRTHDPSTADRPVQAALISDVHVGSQEFMADAWHRFADWLHTEEAANVEYLLLAGDMVEGVGVYPDQDEELDVVDIYEQYERFSEYLKEIPGDIEVRMIPGNHDAVRLAEPQPAFDEELRSIMTAHDAQVHSNPSLVTVEGVTVLMYHGVSLDEVIAELPDEKASYDEPHKAMYQLLKKRHVAPQYGGHTRLAPEDRDYLVMEEVPDVFHTGHVHKLGWGKYHNVLAINSGCWQAQTDFQKSVNIDPDAGFAPILNLDTLDMTVRKFV
ncbi:DNA-directed DNA polymerase II small subunit [Halomicrobium sp. LC1Hm]|uniref:DNA-directed DNA polymerase II small subunit n=1 Tax=Halomicrobium sp. LC1Hm TaxID=2610902 RepID=UPI00129837E6|nr:DNA-directed DNA polymerase II small subunit [Halomicrobium sp. LC1Hm]QGA81074.1 Archaeal DNA polymerase II, small subunit/DNA polymerase delta, subunit B [Halomicrobium sp. LC1Hm]